MAVKNIAFTLMVNEEERQMIRTLAARLERSESDAVRFVVRAKLRELEAKDAITPATPKRRA